MLGSHSPLAPATSPHLSIPDHVRDLLEEIPPLDLEEGQSALDALLADFLGEALPGAGAADHLEEAAGAVGAPCVAAPPAARPEAAKKRPRAEEARAVKGARQRAEAAYREAEAAYRPPRGTNPFALRHSLLEAGYDRVYLMDAPRGVNRLAVQCARDHFRLVQWDQDTTVEISCPLCRTRELPDNTTGVCAVESGLTEIFCEVIYRGTPL